MKNRLKKIMVAVLVAVMVSTTVFMSYEKASEVKAFAIADDLLLLMTIMAGAGVAYVGTEWYGSNLAEDWQDGWARELEEDAEKIIDMYDTAVWKAYNQGQIPDPDDFDPNEDDPSENPTTFEKFKQWFQQHPDFAGSLALTGALGRVLCSFKKDYTDEKYRGLYLSEELSDAAFDSIQPKLSEYPFTFVVKSGYMQFTIFLFKEEVTVHTVFDGSNSFPYLHLNIPQGEYLQYDIFEQAPEYNTYYTRRTSNQSWGDNYFYPLGVNESITNYGNVRIEYPDEIVEPLPSWVDSITQASETENPEAPSFDGVTLPQPVLNPISVPNLQEYLANLNEAVRLPAPQIDTAIQNAVDSLINRLPAPEPLPDYGLGDNVDTSTLDKNQFLLPEWITEKFPFCIPFDLIEAIDLLSSSGRSAPRFEFPIKVSLAGIDEKILVDLSEFDEVADICRKMELLLFVIGLVLITRDLIKG